MRKFLYALLAFLTFGVAFGATLYVPGQCVTIQGAINRAADGDKIQIDPGNYFENITICKDVEIVGSGPQCTTIISENANSVVTFESKCQAKISNLSITGGLSASGGGIICWYWSQPTISNCWIYGNTAEYGGGIYIAAGASPVIRQCVICNNVAKYGGGILSGGIAWPGPRISRCDIYLNAAEQRGGGVFCSNGSWPKLDRSAISGNTANKGHDICVGLMLFPAAMTITSCAVFKSGVYLEEGSRIKWT